jgi:single-strand DNA-binding protein
VSIIGNLTRDAELRYTPSGSAVTRFTVAVNERFATAAATTRSARTTSR